MNCCLSKPLTLLLIINFEYVTWFYSCIDTSGRWGHGGMFDALTKLSSSISDAYERASEHGDLHLGDLHLIKLEGEHEHTLIVLLYRSITAYTYKMLHDSGYIRYLP